MVYQRLFKKDDLVIVESDLNLYSNASVIRVKVGDLIYILENQQSYVRNVMLYDIVCVVLEDALIKNCSLLLKL